LYAKHFMSYGLKNQLGVISTWLLMVVQFQWRLLKRLSKLLIC
jgi:hypothetical protein